MAFHLCFPLHYQIQCVNTKSSSLLCSKTAQRTCPAYWGYSILLSFALSSLPSFHPVLTHALVQSTPEYAFESPKHCMDAPQWIEHVHGLVQFRVVIQFQGSSNVLKSISRHKTREVRLAQKWLRGPVVRDPAKTEERHADLQTNVGLDFRFGNRLFSFFVRVCHVPNSCYFYVRKRQTQRSVIS